MIVIAASPVGDRAQQSVVGVDEDLFDPLDPNDNDESDRSCCFGSQPAAARSDTGRQPGASEADSYLQLASFC